MQVRNNRGELIGEINVIIRPDESAITANTVYSGDRVIKSRAGVQHSGHRNKAQEQGDRGPAGNRVEDWHGLAHYVADSGSTCCRHGNAD